ncbi:hypothetical protein HJG60_011233 [Phyllostomus discolor]|uniref:Uncharacterized protein n=1 Tax=Phyllostomus discolor TaxID=89673 RepID=A0A834E599_9CHIR|nr:hypothetical protein HJG60_011233 [Phyllostomus discolor]
MRAVARLPWQQPWKASHEGTLCPGLEDAAGPPCGGAGGGGGWEREGLTGGGRSQGTLPTSPCSSPGREPASCSFGHALSSVHTCTGEIWERKDCLLCQTVFLTGRPKGWSLSHMTLSERKKKTRQHNN